MPIVPSRNVRSYFYTDDGGHAFSFRGQQQIYEQADGTGSITEAIPFTGGDVSGPWPTTWKPRRVVVVAPDGSAAEIVAPTTTSRLWVGTATTIQLLRKDGTTATYTRVGTKGESKAPLNYPGL